MDLLHLPKFECSPGESRNDCQDGKSPKLQTCVLVERMWKLEYLLVFILFFQVENNRKILVLKETIKQSKF